MSIVNNANPGSQINLLCLIVSTLYKNQGTLNREELFELCRPQKLLWNKNSKTKFKEEFDFWQKKEVCLWRENEIGHLELIDFSFDSCSVENISKYVHSKLFLNIDNDFLIYENKTYAPLYRVLSFLNLIDNFQPFAKKNLSSESLDECLASHFKDFLLNNEERPIFLEWCHFLGYLELIATESRSRVYVVDPTKVISSNLGIIFDSIVEYHVKDFMAALGRSLPVLGFGSYSIKTRNVLETNLAKEIFDPKIPMTLSLALHRLVLEGKLRLLPGADDQNAMQLQLPNGSKSISKIIYLEREA